MAKPDIELLEQDVDGNVLLGRRGEKIVEHYSFYAVFQTSEEYRVMAGVRQIGTLPLDHMMVPGTDFILSGRRWTVLEIHNEDKVIEVMPSKLGRITIFPSMTGRIHDRVVQEMQVVLQSSETPHYLDLTAVKTTQ